jgi:hypothetical protein
MFFSVSPVCLSICQVLRMSAAIVLSVSMCMSTFLSKVRLILFYVGFVCQQKLAKFYALDKISYLRLSIYYCKQVAMSKFYVFACVSLYTCYSAIISMPVDMLSSVYLLIC